MSELISIIVDLLNTPVGRIIAIIFCFAAPAYAMLFFDDDHAEF